MMYIWPLLLKEDILYFTKNTKDQPSLLLCIVLMHSHSVQLLWYSSKVFPLFVPLLLPVLQAEIIPLLIPDFIIIKYQFLSRRAGMSGTNISSSVSGKPRQQNLESHRFLLTFILPE